MFIGTKLYLYHYLGGRGRLHEGTHQKCSCTTQKDLKTIFYSEKHDQKQSGKELSDQQGMKNRWQEYREELYSSNKETQPPLSPQEESVWAMSQLPNNKIPGVAIPIELLRPVHP